MINSFHNEDHLDHDRGCRTWHDRDSGNDAIDLFGDPPWIEEHGHDSLRNYLQPPSCGRLRIIMDLSPP